MALPLLAVALGMMGGTGYLLKKSDERKTESLLSDFIEGASQTQFGQQYAGEALRRIQAETQGGFFDNQQSDRVASLLDQYSQAERQFNQQQLARQDAMQQRGFTRGDALKNEYQQDLQDFAEVQKQYLAAKSALSDEGASNINKVAALFNFFQIMEPGGRVTKDDTGQFQSAGGSGQRLANWFNEIYGKGLSKKTREEIQDALDRQYLVRHEAAEKQRSYYQEQVRNLGNQGLDVSSPFGSLGIDWNQGPPQLRGPAPAPGTYPPAPEGLVVEEEQPWWK